METNLITTSFLYGWFSASSKYCACLWFLCTWFLTYGGSSIPWVFGFARHPWLLQSLSHTAMRGGTLLSKCIVSLWKTRRALESPYHDPSPWTILWSRRVWCIYIVNWHYCLSHMEGSYSISGFPCLISRRVPHVLYNLMHVSWRLSFVIHINILVWIESVLLLLILALFLLVNVHGVCWSWWGLRFLCP